MQVSIRLCSTPLLLLASFPLVRFLPFSHPSLLRRLAQICNRVRVILPGAGLHLRPQKSAEVLTRNHSNTSKISRHPESRGLRHAERRRRVLAGRAPSNPERWPWCHATLLLLQVMCDRAHGVVKAAAKSGKIDPLLGGLIKIRGARSLEQLLYQV